jgi:hypothetical protein
LKSYDQSTSASMRGDARGLHQNERAPLYRKSSLEGLWQHITQPKESLQVVLDGALRRFGIHRHAVFDITDALMEDMPEDLAYPMCHRPDGFVVALGAVNLLR